MFSTTFDLTFSSLHMNPTVQLVLQAATPLGVIVGIASLIYAVDNYRRVMHAQIFMKYTERYEHILEQFPETALAARFDSKFVPKESSPQLRLCVLKYLNLCSEEFYLRTQGYLPEALWSIWEVDLQRIIGSPLFQNEWPFLRTEFLSHQPFLKYVERVQAEYKTANAAHAEISFSDDETTVKIACFAHHGTHFVPNRLMDRTIALVRGGASARATARIRGIGER